METLDDSDSGSPKENFSKQRRNLVLLIAFLYIYIFVGISDINLNQSFLGFQFKLEHPEYIPIILCIIFLYSLIRYYQAWFVLGNQDPGGFKHTFYTEVIREYMQKNQGVRLYDLQFTIIEFHKLF